MGSNVRVQGRYATLSRSAPWNITLVFGCLHFTTDAVHLTRLYGAEKESAILFRTTPFTSSAATLVERATS
jgi:hypothetical protein